MHRIFLLLVLSIAGCHKDEPHYPLARAFYYWKHEYILRRAEDSALTSLSIKKLYLKFFDVTQVGADVLPVAVTEFDSASIRHDLNYVPVVFITQSALLHTDLIDSLASRIASKVQRMASNSGIAFHEIQLDCDWAEHIREKYFRLVRKIKDWVRDRGINISCTIRMHQVKFKDQTGIPPCDRGMLMFYNMSDWRNEKTKNSIFDPDEAEKYVNYIKDYPLKLDVVLPIFHWAIGYHNGAFLAIFNDVDEKTLAAMSIFSRNGNRFTALRDTNVFGALIRQSDILRAEACDIKDLQKFSQRISSLLPNEERSFALYHLDSATVSAYSHDDLQSLFPR